VKAAQQRYETKPVLDDQGQPVRIPLTNKDGSPKMTRAKGSRAARPVFITKTVADKTRPKPLLRCDFPACEHPDRAIQIGQSYKWIKPKSGPYGGRQMNRHAEHPSWQVWDYSSSLSARTQQISHNAWADFPESATEVDEMTDWAASVAEEIRGLAEEKRESASNIEDGFGHETYQSDELNSTADELDGWADEVEAIDFPEVPEPESDDCDECGGSGQVENPDWDADDAEEEGDDYAEPEEIACAECDGSGEVNPDEPSEEQISDWVEECRDAASIVDECPV
jgi:hypothetical protein